MDKYLLEIDWTNPFKKDHSDLISTSTAVAATNEVYNNTCILHALCRYVQMHVCR